MTIISGSKPLFILTLLLFLSLANGCVSRRAATLQEPVMEADTALLYLYRPASMSNVVVAPQVLVDDMEAFPLANDSYTHVQLQPGPHRVRLLLAQRYQGDHEFRFSAEAGQRYYIRLDTELKFRKNELYERRFDLRSVGATAREEILRCSFFPLQGAMPHAGQQGAVSGSSQQPVEAEFSISRSRDPFSRGR
jgi:hypothetical protein